MGETMNQVYSKMSIEDLERALQLIQEKIDPLALERAKIRIFLSVARIRSRGEISPLPQIDNPDTVFDSRRETQDTY